MPSRPSRSAAATKAPLFREAPPTARRTAGIHRAAPDTVDRLHDELGEPTK